MNQKNSRRQFLKGAVGGLGGLIAARLSGLFPEVQPVLANITREKRVSSTEMNTSSQVNVGELYAGFLLLPEEASIPDFVHFPEPGPPLVCGIGNESINSKSLIVKESFNSILELSERVDFPIYMFGDPPPNLSLSSTNLIRYEMGQIFVASANFALLGSNTGSIVTIFAHPNYPKPFPLMWSNPVEDGGPAIELAKVDFLPSPGVMVGLENGHVFHWIKDDIFYQLQIEYLLSGEEAKKLASSLMTVGQ